MIYFSRQQRNKQTPNYPDNSYSLFLLTHREDGGGEEATDSAKADAGHCPITDDSHDKTARRSMMRTVV